MLSAASARSALRRPALRALTSRAAAPAASVRCDDALQNDRRWTAALAAAVMAATYATQHRPAIAEAPAVDDEANIEEEEEESTRILNWSGTHSVDLPPGKYHEPETQAELAQLVSKAYEEGTHIRPVGSALSPNGLAFDSRGMVGLSNLDRVIDINKEERTVTVEAGARVSQVLDALRPHGLTLPNLASIAEQQIGGFVSVGAHGTGAAIPPCDEFVVGLTLVTPSPFGVVKMTEESHGPLFRLTRLGLGALGILSEVTLKVIPAHRLVEQTTVLRRSEAREQLATLLKRHKHVRYMWIPYEDAVVVVTNDPEDELPLTGPGTDVSDGKGGTKKIVTVEDVTPKYTRDEQLAPLRGLLRKLLAKKGDTSLDEETINGMGFGDLRDVILASGNLLDPDHIKKCNSAERQFWERAQGIEVAPSDQKLQFDCGGQQWVYEVCFPVGTYGMPDERSVGFVEELLREIESSGLPAPSPIEQRWTAASTSPLSPASVGPVEHNSYESANALFSWVGAIMYLPSEDLDPTGHRREFVTEAFKEKYCDVVRSVGFKYGAMCHWAKLEDDEAKSVRSHFALFRGPGGPMRPLAAELAMHGWVLPEDHRLTGGTAFSRAPVCPWGVWPQIVAPQIGESPVVESFNKARKMYDPKGVLSCPLLDKIFSLDPGSDE